MSNFGTAGVAVYVALDGMDDDADILVAHAHPTDSSGKKDSVSLRSYTSSCDTLQS